MDTKVEMCGPSSECFVGLLANIISPVVCGLCDRVAKEPIHSPSCGKVFCADCTANDSIDGITGLAHNMDVCARNPTIYCADCGHRLAIRGHDCVHRLKARVESLTEYCEKLLGAERLVTSSPILSTASTDVTTDDRRLSARERKILADLLFCLMLIMIVVMGFALYHLGPVCG